MTKKPKTKKTETEAKIQALEKVAADKSRPKKERKAAKAEIEALRGTFVPTSATGATEAEPSPPSTAADAPASSPVDSAPVEPMAWRERQDAEVARQWAHHSAQLDRTKAADDLDAYILKKGTEPEIVLEAPIPAERIIVDADGVIRFLPDTVDGDGREIGSPYGDTPGVPTQEAQVVETDHGREIVVGAPTPGSAAASSIGGPERGADAQQAEDAALLEKPADPVLENGNGQPIITYVDPATGQTKTKGYTRVTTYIKGLEDTTVLEKWKMRVLLEGGALELLQNDGAAPSLEAVSRAVKRLDDTLRDIDEREKVEGELLGLRRAEVVKEHRDLLEKIAEDLLDLGGAHDKAIKGTDLHRLTEIVDNGQPLPAGTSASDRRDVEAYQAAMVKLGAEVLWTERRIVLDDIQVSGTMDRAYLLKLPGMARRVRVVGDLKTGSVSWGQGKIGMQLALYARGLGYDWTKPTERERLSLNQHHGLLIHLPQGEGRCTVYLVDLELAGKGLDLAKRVREWRNEGKRVFDPKSPLVQVEA